MTESMFFIAGAQRSGTTYLYRLLDEHPEIQMARPVRPEPKFFLLDSLFERGLDDYKNRYFDRTSEAWLWGEKSTSYMESPVAARRIARCFPDAKILFLLRDPIERAISNYWFSVNNGLETLPMAEAFLHEEERWQEYNRERVSVSPYAYLRRGRYIDYLEMYRRYFPAEQIKVLLHEELVQCGADVLRDLYGYLGVSPDFVPVGLGQKVNASRKQSASLSPELRRYLSDYFREPDERLARFLGIDLGRWWQGIE